MAREWNELELRGRVTQAISEIVVGRLVISTDGLRNALQFDDFKMVCLAMKLEELFEVECNDQEFAPVGQEVTCDQVATWVWAKVAKKQEEEAAKAAKRKG